MEKEAQATVACASFFHALNRNSRHQNTRRLNISMNLGVLTLSCTNVACSDSVRLWNCEAREPEESSTRCKNKVKRFGDRACQPL